MGVYHFDPLGLALRLMMSCVEIGWRLDGQLSFVTVVATTFWAFWGDHLQLGLHRGRRPATRETWRQFWKWMGSKEILFITWNLHQGFGGFQTW